MKAVIASIRPEFCEKILNRKKPVEIRKTKPMLKTAFPGEIKVYIYCTQPDNLRHQLWKAATYHYCDDHSHNGGDRTINSKVVAEFTCNTIVTEFGGHFDTQDQLDLYFPGSCLTVKQYNDYCKGKTAYGWHISDLKIYDYPKELTDFYRPGADSIEDLDDGLCCYCRRTDYGEKAYVGSPSGGRYCEGRFCGEAYQEYLDQNFMLTRPPQSWCYVEEMEDRPDVL